jgi:cation transport ATPase
MISPRDVDSPLSRPAQQRLREYKYRCAQSLVFGLPVIGLQWFGHRLGGAPAESERWVAILQALLTGWVIYVAAAGMLFEGIVLTRRYVVPSADLIVAVASVCMFLIGAASVCGIYIVGRPFYHPLMFDYVVVTLSAWCGMRWWSLRRHATTKRSR